MAGGNGGDYRAARIGAAVALTAVIAIVVVADAISSAYAVDPVVLSSLLVAVVTLLGREAVSLFRQPPQPPHPPAPTAPAPWAPGPHVHAAQRNAGIPEIPVEREDAP